jgi:DNA-binding NtrC family response regulator
MVNGPADGNGTHAGSLRPVPIPSGIRSRIIGRSPPIERLFDLISRVAPTRTTVLITGETGTGKELVARAVHDLSGRVHKPLVAVNCSALPESLLESELFGHVRGSFTGAISTRRGLFEEAAGGTVFLDEVSTLSPMIQIKLLRVLEERLVHRVGSVQAIPIDFRLIAATNVDLDEQVANGTFREDLQYRLNVFPIRVPALRERAADIPLLAEHFRLRFGQENDIDPPCLPAATLEHMMSYEWPGNVRELEHFIERALIMYAGTGEIRFEMKRPGHRREAELIDRAADEEWNLDRLEREYILTILEKTGGHRSRAAGILGIDRRTLYRKLRRMEAVNRRS